MARLPKSKTNRQVLAKMVKEMDEIELALLRERLLYVADMYPDNAETREQLKGSFVSADWCIKFGKTLKEYLDFE